MKVVPALSVLSGVVIASMFLYPQEMVRDGMGKKHEQYASVPTVRD